MAIIEPVIRPPSEAGSFLLQVTTGCSANQCTFCGAYMGKPFTIKQQGEIEEDIESRARRFPRTRRVFLMDGDALVIKNARLIPVMKKLQASFPLLTRVSSYANGYNITCRTKAQLKELYDNKMKVIYLGLESGSQKVLDRCNKRSTAEEMIKAVNMSREAGIKASVIVLLGLGGRELSREHAEKTIAALNEMQPRYLSFLSLMLIPGTPASEAAREGSFAELSSKELLREMYDIIKGLELERTVIRSDHASNFLAIEGAFPKDKRKVMMDIENALKDDTRLRPGFLRGL